MPGGCWVCNPLCGKCQPAPKKAVVCPQCGACTIFDKHDIIAGKDLLCKQCASDVSDIARPDTITCSYSGLECSYPCGKGHSSHPTLGYQVCKRNTPPKN